MVTLTTLWVPTSEASEGFAIVVVKRVPPSVPKSVLTANRVTRRRSTRGLGVLLSSSAGPIPGRGESYTEACQSLFSAKRKRIKR